MSKKKRTVYRDAQTGRFVSRSTWARSVARGGTRYKRQSAGLKKHRPQRPRAAEPIGRIDWMVLFTYKGTKSRNNFTADVVVPAPSNASQDEILRRAFAFLGRKFGRQLPADRIDFEIVKGPATNRREPALRKVTHEKA